ncbi:hypothetical protein [Gemmatimonas phototrophica]|jgi:hypothetical protein|uniref:ABM domain-containing protein n=1 Tax=Gemmatimonas phototrophica TaxID=1379270 RepID=A0A143BKH8_9BACT|nr:hypothetical protein [Gemmatimonas phototrophica]AMW05113.1 hypothetical protein GEMMAAP_10350 [Gemmatimonas phototrophica]
MARALTIVERQVPDAERAAYFAALPQRKQRASAVPAHFWVFEHASERGRFIEFTEAGSETELAAVHGQDMSASCWHEVQGG